MAESSEFGITLIKGKSSENKMKSAPQSDVTQTRHFLSDAESEWRGMNYLSICRTYYSRLRFSFV